MAVPQEDIQQRLFIMRHGERVDFVFRHWITECFDKNGNYKRKDMNMPAKILPKKNVPAGYIRDGPLTNMGIQEARLIGEYFKENGIRLDYIFASPAYRCLETARHLLLEMNSLETVINIEPGLFEWMGWYSALPEFFSPSEFMENGYNINTSYQPIIPLESLKLSIKESIDDYYDRGNKISSALTSVHQNGNILLICHGGSLDVLSRKLVGRSSRSKDDADRVMANVPYCSLLGLVKTNENWKLVDLPNSSIAHSSNEAFDWEIMSKI